MQFLINANGRNNKSIFCLLYPRKCYCCMIYAMFCIFALTFNGTCRDTTLYKYDPDGCCSRISRINDNFNGCFCYRFKVSLYLNGNPPISCLPFIFLPAVIFDKLQYKVLLSSFLFIKHFCFFFTRESDIFHLELL